jgi:hypothetical protein
METVKVTLSFLAILTCVACTLLLFREYGRRRIRLLLWSALCFVGLTLSNVLLFVDFVVVPGIDLRLYRLLASLLGMLFLLWGFIGDSES